MKPVVIFGFDMETDIGSWTPFYNGLVKGAPRILAVLDKHKITATFFFVGDAARQYPAIVRNCGRAAVKELDELILLLKQRGADFYACRHLAKLFNIR